jgi:Phage integrase family
MRSFRHAAASFLIAQGCNPKRLLTLMGHSSIQMTFDTYGHLFPNPRRRPRDDAQAAGAASRRMMTGDELRERLQRLCLTRPAAATRLGA